MSLEHPLLSPLVNVGYCGKHVLLIIRVRLKTIIVFNLTLSTTVPSGTVVLKVLQQSGSDCRCHYMKEH